MVTALRDQLHRLVDRLPDAELGAAKRYLEYLDVAGGLPSVLAEAPEDDERLDAGEAAALAEAEAQVAQNALVEDSGFEDALRLARLAVHKAR